MLLSENCQLYSGMGGTSLAVLGGIALLRMRLHVGNAPRQATPDTPGDVEPRFSRGAILGSSPDRTRMTTVMFVDPQRRIGTDMATENNVTDGSCKRTPHPSGEFYPVKVEGHVSAPITAMRRRQPETTALAPHAVGH